MVVLVIKMNTLNYYNNIQNRNYYLILLGNSVFVYFVYAFQLKKMKAQNLRSDIFHDIRENVFHP